MRIRYWLYAAWDMTLATITGSKERMLTGQACLATYKLMKITGARNVEELRKLVTKLDYNMLQIETTKGEIFLARTQPFGD